jgi:hypothetical protein
MPDAVFSNLPRGSAMQSMFHMQTYNTRCTRGACTRHNSHADGTHTGHADVTNTNHMPTRAHVPIRNYKSKCAGFSALVSAERMAMHWFRPNAWQRQKCTRCNALGSAECMAMPKVHAMQCIGFGGMHGNAKAAFRSLEPTCTGQDSKSSSTGHNASHR